MGWLFGTGLSAAGTQSLFVMLIAALYATIRASGGGAQPWLPASPGDLPWLVPAGLVLAAAAAAATEANHRRTETAARIRQVASDMTRGRGKRVQIALLVHLWLAAIALAVLAFAPAPKVWMRLFGLAMPSWISSFAWSAMLSVGVAYFLANATAARRAVIF